MTFDKNQLLKLVETSKDPATVEREWHLETVPGILKALIEEVAHLQDLVDKSWWSREARRIADQIKIGVRFKLRGKIYEPISDWGAPSAFEADRIECTSPDLDKSTTIYFEDLLQAVRLRDELVILAESPT